MVLHYMESNQNLELSLYLPVVYSIVFCNFYFFWVILLSYPPYTTTPLSQG
jgi:hypothetical protein